MNSDIDARCATGYSGAFSGRRTGYEGCSMTSNEDAGMQRRDGCVTTSASSGSGGIVASAVIGADTARNAQGEHA